MEENILPEEKVLAQVQGLEEFFEDSTLYEAVSQELGSMMLECLQEACQEEPGGLTKRLEGFRDAAQGCRVEAKNVPGKERLAYWVGCFAQRLKVQEEPSKAKGVPKEDDVRVEVWDERDRLHIGIQDKKTGKYVVSWWDADARQMFDDGFFERRRLEASVLEYAKEHGLIR